MLTLSNEIRVLSLFVHLTATAVWIGGLLATMILVWPTMRKGLEGNVVLYRLLSGFRKRFYPISNLSLAALITTGLFQMASDPNYDGFLTFDNPWSQIMLLKHILIAVMALAGLLLQYAVAPALERASLLLEREKGDDSTVEEWDKLRQREIMLTWFNGLLGLGIVGLSVWLSIL